MSKSYLHKAYVALSLLCVLCHITFASAAEFLPQKFETCEKLDEDCPPCNGTHTLSPTGLLHLSWNSELKESAKSAQSVIVAGAANSSQIVRMEDTNILHTSMVYLCCYDAFEMFKIHLVLKQFKWSSFAVTYSDFGCNLDHDGKIVYMHALPNADGQSKMMDWIHKIEAIFKERGIRVNNPRKTMFHMTLARVAPSYPVDEMVKKLRGEKFGSLTFCCFEVAGIKYYADDGCPEGEDVQCQKLELA